MRKQDFLWFAPAVLLLSFLSLSCGEADEGSLAYPYADGDEEADAEAGEALPLPNDCDSVSELFTVKAMLADEAHPCHDWVSDCFGRMAKGGAGGSGFVLSIATEATTAIGVTALHVPKDLLGGAAGELLAAKLVNPEEIEAYHFFRITEEEAGEPSELANASFPLFRPSIPAIETENSLRNIRPRHDFILYALDDQRLETAPLPQTPEPIRHAPPPFHDPQEKAQETPAFTSATAGALVLMFGYSSTTGELSAAVGRVLNEAEIEEALAALREANDEEGYIDYDEEAEAMIHGVAYPGMSGGAIFAENRLPVAVLVRASEAQNVATPIVRGVRLGFIVDEVEKAFKQLEEEAQSGLRPYLTEAMMQ